MRDGAVEIRIVREKIARDEVKKCAEETFGDMVKVVVDIERNVMTVGGELHADGEALLLEDGSRQEHIWGANIYPDNSEEDQIVFRALINIRPRTGNRSMQIESETIKGRVRKVIEDLTG